MNRLGKQFRKKSDPKIEKRKNQSQIAACDQKTASEKENFCSNTAKKSRCKTSRIFAPLPISA